MYLQYLKSTHNLHKPTLHRSSMYLPLIYSLDSLVGYIMLKPSMRLLGSVIARRYLQTLEFSLCGVLCASMLFMLFVEA